MGLIIYFSAHSISKEKIGMIDESGIFEGKIDADKPSHSITYLDAVDGKSIKELAENSESDLILHVYAQQKGKVDSINIFGEGSVSLLTQEFVSDQLDETYEAKLLKEAGLNKIQIDSLSKQDLKVQSRTFELKETHSGAAMAIGYAMGFLIYMIIFIYGAGVMRGVMEEKTNRIAEVIVSSVTPFQLMLGKILGIALVGLTQFAMWFVLIGILQLVGGAILVGTNADAIQSLASNPEMMNAMPQNEVLEQLMKFKDLPWGLIIFSFLFYFLGGYFIYAALFAAVGSLVNEDPQDAQQLMFPITIPVMLGMVIMAVSMNDPHSGLAVFGSIFPLTSPIVMMARIPYNPPAWQIVLSMVLLILSFLAITWAAAKIYRVGILMYGKKATWKEIFRWVREA